MSRVYVMAKATKPVMYWTAGGVSPKSAKLTAARKTMPMISPEISPKLWMATGISESMPMMITTS